MNDSAALKPEPPLSLYSLKNMNDTAALKPEPPLSLYSLNNMNDSAALKPEPPLSLYSLNNMNDSAALKPEPPPPLLPQPSSISSSSRLRRRNSIATSVVVVPTKLSFITSTTTKPLQSSNSFPHQNGTVPRPPPLDFELLSSSSSLNYTSLKDLLPSSSASASATNAMASPTATVASGYEISIRNRLVKQAAWAYLQPMSSSPGSSGTHFLHRLWLSLISFFKRRVVPALTQLLQRVCR
jgi:hypothetical protein